MPIAQELNIDQTASAADMANEIFGDGVTVTGATYYGDGQSSGIYTGADTTSAGVAPADNGVILSTGRVSDFTQSNGTTNTNTSGSTSTNTSGVNNNALFNSLAGTRTYDASYLEISFTSTGDTVTIDFVIASEEYPEWVNSQYNDVVGVWVNGVEAQVSIGDGTASIGNVNGSDTANLYIDNTSDQYNTEMDGFTITLTFTAPVSTTGTNTMIIGVADVSDSSYDTNLLIAGGGVQSTIIAEDDSMNMGLNTTKTLAPLDNDTGSGALTVTHINGIAVDATDLANNSVTLSTGQTVTLNLDGTFTIQSDGDVETVYFTYTMEDNLGNVDDGIVEINQMACFVTGTRVDTPDGPCPIEHLRPGDLVMTRDSGPQPVRWIGQSTTPGTDAMAPVRIRAGFLGATRDLWVSQQHQILLEDYRAAILFGEHEVLVRARDLRNDGGVMIEPRAMVTYVHILFDTHQIVRAHGVWSESYLPGPMTMPGFDARVQKEIITLFPQIDPGNWQGYGMSARRELKSFEGRLLAH